MSSKKLLDRLAKHNEHVELTDDDIKRLLKGKTRIVTYDELKQVRHIEDILEPYGNVIILYQETENAGHWAVVVDRGKMFEFFDSYGYYPDEVLPHMPHSGSKPVLRKLLEKTGKTVIWNPIQLQADDSKIATCGYYCLLRVILKKLPLLDFLKIFIRKKKSPDYIASYLTTAIAIKNELKGKIRR